MPANKDTLLPLPDADEDDPAAWSLRLQALAQLRALSEESESQERPLHLP